MEVMLREFRENGLGMSQKEFAERIGVSQNTVSRWEDNPEQLSFSVLQNIANTFKCSIEDIIQERKVTLVLEPWKAPKKKLSEFKNIEKSFRNFLDDFKDKNTKSGESFSYKKLRKERNELMEVGRQFLSKPSVAFLGSSDAGKSTMINTILGKTTLPAQWTPTTSSGTKLVHIWDKPQYMEEDTTAVFQSSISEPLIQTHLLHDKKYFENHLVEKGSINLIEEFGTHAGEKSRLKANGGDINYTIVTYIDSPILEACEIWDIPGTGATSNEDISDDYTAKIARQGADIMVYLSVSNQFMTNDMSHASDIILSTRDFHKIDNRIDPFENLFIVASQAGIVANNPSDSDIYKILDKRINDLADTIPDNEWKRINNYNDLEDTIEYTSQDLVDRGFPFERGDLKLQQEFKTAFLNLLQKVIDMKMLQFKRLKDRDFEAFNNKIKSETEKYGRYINDAHMAQRDYDDFLKRKPLIHKRNMEMVEFIKSEALANKKSSNNEIEQMFEEIVNIENIQKLIKEKGFGKKREGKERFSTWLINELESRVSSILEYKSQNFTENILEKLEAYEKIDVNIKTNGFNYTSTFIGGLSSLASIGAFSIYFNSLGNLGGYILVAKAVSVLTGLGIKIPGGMPAALHFVKLLGGPWVFAISAAITIGIITSKVVGGNWEKEFAKQIVKNLNKKYKSKSKDDEEFHGKNFLEIFQHSSDKYWQETHDSISFEIVNKEFADLEKQLARDSSIDIDDINEFTSIISSLKSLKITYDEKEGMVHV